MTRFSNIPGVLSRCLAVAITLSGLAISFVSRAQDVKPIKVPLALANGSAAPTASAAPPKPHEATTPPAAASADPCLAGQFDLRVQCVKDFSKALNEVCSASPGALKQELDGIAAAKLARLSPSERAKAKPPAGAPPVDQSATEAAAIRKGMCDVLCPAGADSSLCNMSEVVQNATVAAAWTDFLAARKYAAEQLAKSKTLAGADKSDAENFKLAKLNQQVNGGAANTAGVPFDAAGAAASFLQGLAKLIVDRTKAEAVGWLLDQLGSDLCGDSEDRTKLTVEQLEIGKYWLPSVCALARGQRLSGYGGGGAMLEALRGAIQSDLEHWPGAAASFAPAAIYFSDIPQKDRPDTIAACDLKQEENSAKELTCNAIAEVRLATREGVTDMLKGRDPLASLHDLSTAYRDVSKPDADGSPFKSPKLQVTACALGLPQDVTQFDKNMAVSLLADGDRAHAAVLAALVSVPACFDIVADPAHTQWQRLYTVFSLEHQVGALTGDAWTRLKALDAAVVELESAAQGLSAAQTKLLGVPAPTLSGTPDAASLLDTLSAYQAGIANGIMGPAQQRMLRAVIGVADAGAAVGQTGVQIAKGGCNSFKKLATCKVDFEKAKSTLDDIRRYIAIAGEAANGDWAKSSLAVLTAIRQAGPGGLGASRAQHLLLRHIGLLVAIVSARDSDGIAKALDEAAAPVGAWRGKGVDGANTISITAHAGLFAALELRHGTYGADYEDWARHFQAPALALPVGLEFAHGTGGCISPIALFLPLLDPAAFLQYDAERDGKLPGASIKTALSPGLGVRFGIDGSPFSVMPQVVYRPGFRQWNSKFSGTGADALQFGLLLSVDATLFQLSRSEKTQ